MTKPTDRTSWPCHSSQKDLIGRLLKQGDTVQLTYEVTEQLPPKCSGCGKRDTLPSEDPKVWFCSNCLEQVRKP